ncbi:MAG: excinuclease ABC subunit UvrB [Desulfobacterales bacterium]|nr:excinuclease ABC subunit UvrB [Desulfobacterales bacterium]
MSVFTVHSEFSPKGDQPKAIAQLSDGVLLGKKCQVLLGVTGSGKTYTMAHVIANMKKPTLIIAPNKTLAAQLFNEFKSFFPNNAVEYFVSYYDYYQPEAYIPTSDTYIQKDSAINETIDKMRHSATRSLLSRPDVIVVSSVSCIYGIGAPEDYLEMRVELNINHEVVRNKLLSDLVAIQYERNDIDFYRGVFRVRGDRVELFPAYEEDKAIRIDFFGDTIEDICEIDPLTGAGGKHLETITIFPATHYVTPKINRQAIIQTIKQELKIRVEHFQNTNKLIEAQRIEERTLCDIEMLNEFGYCNGIENYSRHLTRRAPGSHPPTLFDYFPNDFLLIIDESHITIPQIRGMFHGDLSRKTNLVEYGFRLPSALDNRPLRFDEFLNKLNQVIYVSATPAEYELEQAYGNIVEQIVRPTGLIDPEIDIRPATHQVDDLYEEIQKRIRMNDKVLVTTLTKRMAEDLQEYYSEMGLRVRYLHSEVHTLERIEIIQDLRKNLFDVLIGINLLREGLDIPEVSLVAILDADKEGFLRSERSLVQTCGRAARNERGKVIMYADKMTPSMKRAVDETLRRRGIQQAYNEAHQIIPKTIQKGVTSFIDQIYQDVSHQTQYSVSESKEQFVSEDKLGELIVSIEKEMKQAAKELAFEKAAVLRDRIKELKRLGMV